MRLQGHSQSKKYCIYIICIHLLGLKSDKLHKIFRDIDIKYLTVA